MDLARGWWSFLLSALILLASTSALAQQGEEGPPPPPPPVEDTQKPPSAAESTDETANEPPAPELPEDEAVEVDGQADPAGWSLLRRAVEHLARGQRAQARRLLEQLAQDYPDHPATDVSSEALAVLREKGARRAPALGDDEEKSGLARAELAFFQTAHGIVLGAELCAMIECDSEQAVVAALGAGGALGLTLSLVPTQDGITPGHSLLLNSGTAWGFGNGLLAGIALDIDGSEYAGLLAGSQLAGLGVGALIWDIARPTDGEVAMANSGGLWTGFLTFLVHAANDFDAEDSTIAWSVLLLSDLGIVGGAALSQRYPMSRGRTFVIDSGGILGFLVGIGTYIFIEPDVTSPTAFSVMGILGTVTGLGTATYLTRNWDVEASDDFSANWGVSPTDGGALLSVGGTF